MEQQPGYEGANEIALQRVTRQTYENGAPLFPNGYGKESSEPVTPVTSCPDIVLAYL